MSYEIRMYTNGGKERIEYKPTKMRMLTNEEMADAFLALHRQLANKPVNYEKVYYFRRETCEEAVSMRIMERTDDGGYMYNGHLVVHPEELNGGENE